VRILSIDGGGYLGLAPAAFLSALEERFQARAADRFDLFCGTSTGAIIALALASGMSASEVCALYERFGAAVFKWARLWRTVPWLKSLRAVPYALYDNAPLKAALTEAFGDLTLDDLHKAGKKVLVTAFNVTCGTPTVFKTDHGPGLTAHGRFLVRDVALASSAAPMYLPLVELIDPVDGVRERFCDGAMVSNSPALLGYAEAVSHLAQDPTDLAILSLGTPRSDLAEQQSALRWRERRIARGLWGWRLGERIIEMTIDGGATVAHTALTRIAKATGAKYSRITLDRPNGLDIDFATAAATATLRQIGVAKARDGTIHSELASFFIDD